MQNECFCGKFISAMNSLYTDDTMIVINLSSFEWVTFEKILNRILIQISRCHFLSQLHLRNRQNVFHLPFLLLLRGQNLNDFCFD